MKLILNVPLLNTWLFLWLAVKTVEASTTRHVLSDLEPAATYEVTLVGRGHEKNSSQVTRQRMVIESGRQLNDLQKLYSFFFHILDAYHNMIAPLEVYKIWIRNLNICHWQAWKSFFTFKFECHWNFESFSGLFIKVFFRAFWCFSPWKSTT